MPSPLPRILLPLTIPASWLYRSAVAVRNRRYDQSGARRVDAPVISVGNVTTGGVGKSPMVKWIAKLLLDAGHQPAICMRGYGASRTQRSDEQMEYEAKLPHVPVVADPDRATALTAFLATHPQIDCVLLDDGFQHRQLYRDLDLVLIDATRDTFSDRLLPAGHLREPLENLVRADAVIVTHAEQVNDQLEQAIAAWHRRPPLAWARHAWRSLRCNDREGESSVSVQWLRGKRVLTMVGIGNPQAVHDQLEQAGAIITASVPARDHERYTDDKLLQARRAAAGLDAMVVTGKDWVKLRSVLNLHDWPVPVVVPELDIDVFRGREALAAMILGVVNDRANH